MMENAAHSPRLERWTRAMVQYRWLVLLGWLALVVASLAVTPSLAEKLSNRYSVPGSEGDRVEQVLEEHYGQLSEGALMLVVRAEDGTTAEQLVPAVRAAAERGQRELPDSSVKSVAPVSEDVVVATIATTLEQADAKVYVDDMRRAVGDVEGAGATHVTGSAAFSHDLDPVLNDDLKRGELYFALPVALFIVAMVFGTLGFLLPFMFAAATIPATLGVVFMFAQVLDLSSYVLNMVVGIGLGISIDYSLLMYYRYREERMRGGVASSDSATRVDAVVTTMQTAGRAVVFSGTAVAIGLAVLLLMPLPFMQGFGVAGLVIPIVSILASLTLMPALLYMTSHRLERMAFLPRRMMARRDDTESGFWVRLSTVIMRRPVPVFLVSALALLALAAPATQLEVTPGSSAGIPRNLDSTRGDDILSDALGKGATVPTTVVVDGGEAGAARSPEVQAAVARMVRQLAADKEIVSVTGPESESAYADDDRYVRIDAVGRHEYGEPETRDLVERVRGTYVEEARFPSSASVDVGGWTALSVDLVDRAYETFPWLVVGVLILTYGLLLRAFRSLLLPLKAIVLNLLSIGAAYGTLVLVFTTPVAEAVGLAHSERIEFWIPVFMFAMLFGLSMDYEVFLVSRMREAWDETHDNARAVALGLARTGRLVTAAGLIMVAAFGGFMASSPVGFQQFGLGLCTAILIDVTLVRALLLPSTMALLGRWNWWLPEWVARLARVAPSPLDPAPAAAAGASAGSEDPVPAAAPEAVREPAGRV